MDAVKQAHTGASEITVPPLNLAGNFETLRDEILSELAAVAASGQYVLGPKVAAFEQALAEYCGVRHAVGVSSGTDALLMALMALGIGPGDEVIVPTFTFFATAGTVARVGARPVFCDMEPTTYNLDPAQLAARITPRTKALIPVDLYGQLADYSEILALAQRHGLPVIEDAAQAIGARSPGGKMAGSFGTCAALSFYPTKNLGALGDAGAILTDDDRLAESFRKLRVHGSGHTYYHEQVGGNFRMDALQAALLALKLPHLESWTEQRRARAAEYNQLLGTFGLAPRHVQAPAERHGRHVYHQYVIRSGQRDELAAWLKARGIGCGVYYPLPLHLQKCFAPLGYREGDFPHAEAAAREVLALPIYPELTAAQQWAVVSNLKLFFSRNC